LFNGAGVYLESGAESMKPDEYEARRAQTQQVLTGEQIRRTRNALLVLFGVVAFVIGACTTGVALCQDYRRAAGVEPGDLLATDGRADKLHWCDFFGVEVAP
jgi:hypothetical protein